MADHGAGHSPRAITSLQNDRVKLIRSLEMRKARKETGLFVAEGLAILIAARDAGWMPTMLAYRAGSADSGAARDYVGAALQAGAEVLEVSDSVLEKIAAKDNPQSVIGVFAQRWAQPPEMAAIGATATWLALEEVRDPGNLGSIIRTLDAAGGAGVILVGTTCDPYQRECVRATMGSIFAMPIVRMTLPEFLGWRAEWPGDVAGTHLSGREDMRAVAWRHPVLLTMGSEGPGLSDAMAGVCNRLVKIPMAGRLDSLNLSVATGIALYEIRRAFLKLNV